MKKRVTTWTVRKKKAAGEPLVMITAYDATFAKLVDEAGADLILVGDSLGNVIQGQETTLPVTLDHMIYHCQCVARGASRPMIIGDLPFGSYQASVEDGLRAAHRLMKEGQCHAVKLEGGEQHAELVSRLTSAGVPVMGHLGLTPQSVHAFGGYRVQGRGDEAAERLVKDAHALQEAGAFSLVLECVPSPLAKRVTQELDIPTIGIGAGADCDGQVLVIYDLLGMNPSFVPKFVKPYENLHDRITSAVSSYGEEVRARAFPDEEHTWEE